MCVGQGHKGHVHVAKSMLKKIIDIQKRKLKLMFHHMMWLELSHTHAQGLEKLIIII